MPERTGGKGEVKTSCAATELSSQKPNLSRGMIFFKKKGAKTPLGGRVGFGEKKGEKPPFRRNCKKLRFSLRTLQEAEVLSNIFEKCKRP